jgi:signal transduction histidine kinase
MWGSNPRRQHSAARPLSRDVEEGIMITFLVVVAIIVVLVIVSALAVCIMAVTPGRKS